MDCTQRTQSEKTPETVKQMKEQLLVTDDMLLCNRYFFEFIKFIEFHKKILVFLKLKKQNKTDMMIKLISKRIMKHLKILSPSFK